MDDRAFRAFDSALERLELWIQRHDYDDPPTAVDDAVLHLKRMENVRRESLGSERYFELRDGGNCGRVVGGLIYVRNLIEHPHEGVLVNFDSLKGRFRVGQSRLGGGDRLGGAVRLLWRPLSDVLLDLPSPRKQDKWKRDDMYRELVQDREVMQTFMQAKSFFGSLPG